MTRFAVVVAFVLVVVYAGHAIARIAIDVFHIALIVVCVAAAAAGITFGAVRLVQAIRDLRSGRAKKIADNLAGAPQWPLPAAEVARLRLVAASQRDEPGP